MNRIFSISPLILQTAIWPIVRPLFWFFLRLKVRGLENLTLARKYDRTYMLKRGVIFATGHSSELDSVLVPASLPFLSPLMPMFYTSREWSFYKNSGWRKYFYGGFLFKLWGAHRLHSGKHDYETSLRTHIELLESGNSLCLFPDGRRLPENEIGTIAHGGVGFLAWRTNALVIPVRITGIFHMSLYEFLTRKRTALVAFGKPIHPSELLQGEEQPTIGEIKTAVGKIIQAIKQL